MNFKPQKWKIGKHLTIEITPEKFSLKGVLELIFLLIIIMLLVKLFV